MIRFAFEDGDVFRFSTSCLAENQASERVMQRCGFTKEAERRSYAWYGGRMKDRVEYRLLKDEWMTRGAMVPADILPGSLGYSEKTLARIYTANTCSSKMSNPGRTATGTTSSLL